MRSKQVQILSGICGVQLIGYACRAAGFKTDIWIGFAGSVFLYIWQFRKRAEKNALRVILRYQKKSGYVRNAVIFFSRDCQKNS